MGDWKEYSLGEVINLKRGYDLPNQSRRHGHVPIFSSSGISDYHEEAMVSGPGVITGRYGTIGEVFYSDRDFWPLNTTLYVQDFKGNSPKYIYYLLKTLDYEKYSDKSAVPGINRNDVHTELVIIPLPPEQQAIALVLCSLDDKIDLLHSQNKTLEALAEAFFRQWFVEKPNAAWEEKGLDEIADFLNGLACQKYPPISGKQTLPVIKIREIRQGISDNTDQVNVDVPDKYIINDGDILFSWSGSLDIVVWSHGKGVLNQHLFKVTSDIYPEWFYFLWIKHYLPEFRNIASDKATTMGHIQRHHLSDAVVVVPSDENMLDFDQLFSPVFRKIKNNLFQIRTLIRLRDTLLPKLLSGDIRVKE